eukprot:TRINITY_DN1680_c0_g1_i1.p1 TRINITY_DN1680_c0_g1~~TRINITY_DN1680_c0_g1_i1.p1  ORF type:complete len:365 (+),score=130.19 TRINITY_DN1680_c0_g1_i1:79-1173(+)
MASSAALAALKKALLPFYMSATILWGTAICLGLFAYRMVLRPFRPGLYIKTGYHYVSNGITLMFLFALQEVGRVRVKVQSECSEAELVAEQSALVMYNHVNDLDWLVMQYFMRGTDKMGCLRGLGKDSLRYVPVVGWICWLGDFIFLKRSMEKDAKRLDSGMAQLKVAKADGADFWLSFFPEGTRLTPKKYEESVAWQTKNGIEPLKHLQYPRVKGFQVLWKGLREDVDAVYAVTLGYPKEMPSFFGLFSGKDPVEVAFLVEKLDDKALRQCGDDDAKLKEFLVADWRTRDEHLEHFATKGTFSAPDRQGLSRSIPHLRSWGTAILCTVHTVLFGCLYLAGWHAALQVTLTSHAALALMAVLML